MKKSTSSMLSVFIAFVLVFGVFSYKENIYGQSATSNANNIAIPLTTNPTNTPLTPMATAPQTTANPSSSNMGSMNMNSMANTAKAPIILISNRDKQEKLGKFLNIPKCKTIT